MRRLLSPSISLAIILGLSVVFAATAETRSRGFRSRRAEGMLRSQPFTLAGEFSGTLSGDIVLNGIPYRLDPGAFVYEIGNGIIPVGTDVQDRYVTISGLQTSLGTVVYSVILRPAGEATFESNVDMSSKVHIRDAGAPR